MTTTCLLQPPPAFHLQKRQGKATPGPVSPAPAGASGGGRPVQFSKDSSDVLGGPHIDQVPGCPACHLPARLPVLGLEDQGDQSVPPRPPGTTWANNDPFRSLVLASCPGLTARGSSCQPDNPSKLCQCPRRSVSFLLSGELREGELGSRVPVVGTLAPAMAPG